MFTKVEPLLDRLNTLLYSSNGSEWQAELEKFLEGKPCWTSQPLPVITSDVSLLFD